MIAYVSADLAFRIQYVVMAVIAVSLVLVLGNVDVWQSDTSPTLWGTFPGSPESQFSGTDFWGVFAVFFPAVTGIMAGANMSGELKNPRRSIPLGTLSAIGVSLVIYVVLAFWVVRAGSVDELASNYTIMLDKSLWGPGVLAGLLGATFSSALTSLVGAPRILAALAHDKIFPRGGWLARTEWGTPECHARHGRRRARRVADARSQPDRAVDHDVLPDRVHGDQRGAARREEPGS